MDSLFIWHADKKGDGSRPDPLNPPIRGWKLEAKTFKNLAKGKNYTVRFRVIKKLSNKTYKSKLSGEKRIRLFE